VKEKYGDRVAVEHRSFLLRAEADPSVVFNDYRRQHWSRANEQGDGGTFRAWHSDEPFPNHSLPSSEASKCAALQGADAFHRYHLALLKAVFEDSRNISDPQVLIQIAEEEGLDMPRFKETFLSGSQRDGVLREYFEAVQGFGVQSIPTVIIGRERALVGAVARSEYDRAIDDLLGPNGPAGQ
jgi:predicted DsbA family dithiol-disulfide isomerase